MPGHNTHPVFAAHGDLPATLGPSSNHGRVWEVGNPEHPAVVFEFAGQAAAFAPDGGPLVVAGDEETVLTWSTRNWEIVSAARSRVVTAPGQSAYFTFPGVGPDGRTVATADPLSLRTWTINVDDAIN